MIGALALAFSVAALPVAAGAGSGITFNQDYLEDLFITREIKIDDIPAVFSHVFAALPAQVNVYPTENYYYFSFLHGGVSYSGNFRLDVRDRDEGILHFVYFNQAEAWNSELTVQYRALSLADGVKVEKLRDLVYRVEYGGKSTVFALNDLREVTPPPDKLAPGETFIGPVFDESGLQFYLLFHGEEKRFTYVLNEAAPPAERLLAYSDTDSDILLGMRTGFAFYKDRFQDRKILIGVYAGNVENNNFLDGPFDQLPDNFLKGDELRQAILTLYPELKDEIDRLGNFKEQEGRVLINPYINYSFLSELEEFHKCADSGLDRVGFYRCLQPSEGQ